MIAWGKNKSESRVTAEFYNCAIEVMRGAEAIDRYEAMDEQEAFDIEYWDLEEAKLRRQPPEKGARPSGSRGYRRGRRNRQSDGASRVRRAHTLFALILMKRLQKPPPGDHHAVWSRDRCCRHRGEQLWASGGLEL